MLKRRKIVSFIDELPLDCWGKIVSFLSTRSDFESVILSVKGFWEYANEIFPRCTEHIIYDLPRDKKIFSRKSYVSSLNYDPTFFTESHLKSYSSMGDLLDFMNMKFPNLLRLRIALKVHRRRLTPELPPTPENQVKNLKTFVNNADYSKCPSSIRYLNLQVSLPFLQIRLPSLPSLTKLVLSRKCLCTVRNIVKNETSGLDISGIENQLPNLRDFYIHCCSKRSAMEKTGLSLLPISRLSCLQSLLLENEVTDENFFPPINSLRFVGLVGTTSRWIESIQNLRNLRKLKISVIPKYEKEKRYRMRLSLNMLIEGFPFLESVRIRSSKSCSYTRNNGTLSMKNLPSLKAVKFVGKDPCELFPITIDAPKLQKFYAFEWNAEIDMSPTTGQCLKSMGFFRSKMGPVLKQNFLSFKNLENFQYRVTITDPTAPDSSEMFVFADFPRLKKIYFPDILICEISNCPMLESVRLHPVKNFKMLGKLPCLKEVIVAVDRQSDLDLYFEFVQNINKYLPSVHVISLHPFRFDKLQILDGDSWIDKNVDTLVVDFRRSFKNCRNFTLDLRHFSNIKELHISQIHFNFPKVLILKDFLVLKKLNLSSHRFVSSSGEFTRIVLENLPNCRTLFIGRGFASVHSVTIHRVPIVNLIVSLSPHSRMVTNRSGYFKSKLVINKELFPLLKRLEIRVKEVEKKNIVHGLEMMEDYYRIGMISNLDNLDTITISGTKHNTVFPVIALVRNINLKKVMVKAKLLVNNMLGFERYAPETITLGEYIDRLSQRENVIEIENF